MVTSFCMNHGTRADLTLPPSTKHAGMTEVDTVLAIELIETAHHVVGLAWAGDGPFVGTKPRAFSPGNQRRHRPNPGIFRAGKRDALATCNQCISGTGHHGASYLRVHEETFRIAA
jgi:hypothetical protein